MSTAAGRTCLERLAEDTSRIKDLHLSWHDLRGEDSNILVEISSCNLGSLEVLNLGQAHVPDALLAGTKALRELQLRNCAVRCESLPCKNLKVFTLSNVDYTNESSPTLSSLLPKIGSMALLTSLTLKYAFTLQSKDDRPPHIHLPNLEIFVVESTPVEIIALLQSVFYPTTANVNISTELVEGQTDEIGILFAAIKRSRSPALNEAPCLKFSYTEHDILNDRYGPQVILSLYTKILDDSPDVSYGYSEALPDFNITLDWLDRDTPANSVGRILSTFMSADVLPLDSVKYVNLETNLPCTYTDAASLASTIGRLPAVCDISATGGMIQTISKAMQRKLDDDSGHYSFPNLAVLNLISYEPYIDGFNLEMPYDDFDADILLTSLRLRRKHNIGLKKLILDEAGNEWINDKILLDLLRAVDSLQLTPPCIIEKRDSMFKRQV